MTFEYKLLRNEIYDNIKKQDNINNLIITILGFSVIFTTKYANIIFLITVLFVSAVLLSRIIHCRNVVYYLSSYLIKLEQNNPNLEINWENNIKKIKEKLLSINRKNVPKMIFLQISYKSTFIMKNMGNLVLSTFTFIEIILILQTVKTKLIFLIFLYSSAIIAYILNLIFTFIICVDRKLKSEYEEIWDEVVFKKIK